MTDQPQGRTGEQCKSAGTYSCESGSKRFYDEGEAFGPCPVSGQTTRWVRTT